MSQWIYSQNGQTKGPVSETQLINLVLQQELDISDYVMNPADNLWKRIKDIPALLDKIHAPETAIPHDPGLVEALQEYIDSEGSHNVYFYIPISRLIKMSIITAGIYLAYWWYKQWYYWAAKKGQRHKSPDREFGYFLAPLYLFDKIQIDPELNKVERADFSGRTLIIGLIVFGVVLYAISLAAGLKGAYFALISVIGALGGIMFFLPVQSYINRVNEKLGNHYDKPGLGHYACLVLGVGYWLLEAFSYLVK